MRWQICLTNAPIHYHIWISSLSCSVLDFLFHSVHFHLISFSFHSPVQHWVQMNGLASPSLARALPCIRTNNKAGRQAYHAQFITVLPYFTVKRFCIVHSFNTGRYDSPNLTESFDWRRFFVLSLTHFPLILRNA